MLLFYQQFCLCKHVQSSFSHSIDSVIRIIKVVPLNINCGDNHEPSVACYRVFSMDFQKRFSRAFNYFSITTFKIIIKCHQPKSQILPWKRGYITLQIRFLICSAKLEFETKSFLFHQTSQTRQMGAYFTENVFFIKYY